MNSYIIIYIRFDSLLSVAQSAQYKHCLHVKRLIWLSPIKESDSLLVFSNTARDMEVLKVPHLIGVCKGQSPSIYYIGNGLGALEFDGCIWCSV